MRLKLRILLIILFVLSSKFSSAQEDPIKILIGTWQLCMSFDTLNTSCNKPFSKFILKPNGQFEGGKFTCNDIKVPVLGTWKFEKNSIYISAYEAVCFKMPARGHYDIKFLNDSLFYTKTISNAGENNGKPIFTIFKKVN